MNRYKVVSINHVHFNELDNGDTEVRLGKNHSIRDFYVMVKYTVYERYYRGNH